jgi:hypothetical protein
LLPAASSAVAWWITTLTPRRMSRVHDLLLRNVVTAKVTLGMDTTPQNLLTPTPTPHARTHQRPAYVAVATDLTFIEPS